ncbi:MCP four helix bundle domain-containing protein, partial [Pseudomonas sp. AB6]
MKNWTLRQRISASFAVIIAIMLLMVVVSYTRLLSIQSSEEKVETDALPGLYYSTMVRSAWVNSYLATLQLFSEDQGRVLTPAEISNFKGYEDTLVGELNNYRKTVFDAEDQASVDEFEKQHAD